MLVLSRRHSVAVRGGRLDSFRAMPEAVDRLGGGGPELRAQGRTPPQLGGQCFNRTEGGGADMMFHSLDIVIDDAFAQAKELKKISEELVSMGDAARQFFAGSGQNESAIFFVFEQTLRAEALDHVGHAGLRDLQSGSDVDNARVAFGIDQFENAFKIILHCGGTAQSGA